MPLSIPVGYTLTVGQFLGERPVATIECRACHWRETFDVTLDGDAAVTGREVWSAIRRYTDHLCGPVSLHEQGRAMDVYVGTDMQDSPTSAALHSYVSAVADEIERSC